MSKFPAFDDRIVSVPLSPRIDSSNGLEPYVARTVRVEVDAVVWDGTAPAP